MVGKEKRKMGTSPHSIALLAMGEKCWILLSTFTGKSYVLNVRKHGPSDMFSRESLFEIHIRCHIISD